MSFFKENIVWVAPITAFILVVMGYPDREGGLPRGGSGSPQSAVVAAGDLHDQRQLAKFNASVAAALADPQGTDTGRPEATDLFTTADQTSAVQVTRNAPLDLLQIAPAEEQLAEPVGQTDPFVGDSRAGVVAWARPVPALASSCNQELNELASSTRVYFPSGTLSGEETGLSAARLLGMVLQDCPGYAVRVEGHSDPSGDPASNLKLSKMRAEAVINRLAASGIDTTRFTAVGFGDTRPAKVTGEKSAAYYDRRVAFSITKPVHQASFASPAKVGLAPAGRCVAQLDRKAAKLHQFYAPGSIVAAANDIDGLLGLAAEVADCDGAWLRIVGLHAKGSESRENVSTGWLRALAMRNALIAAGHDKGRLLVGAPSYAVPVLGDPGASQSRLDFQVVSD
ncbi:OmpA family protein [Sulfitobacter sp. M57]|uniref:OmpA family protein n=1 Tax=unclassified Sulfitobacter TaxID=196795 RepID=UPI0023E2D640|nr:MULTISPECIES: OmpA family protein [unclassified Sulfitobacter]MDF3432112.1 OmpA family protein [Sulfitobacter sp. KE42]MDF3457752.1 OmpA family protein [Sulfitobacter sp. S74]MDF3477100.1 OmpA family protein [Sulfitobacter sp. M53]MDF3480998.1 OmpA family protein [Sulfitobacter sp. M24]MDF3484895.1 OmpA family protein [Sulfitobacter sp. Ks13]MDF3519999.1 OmpA family protein [Sulfitobacter sp. M74]MDF3543428.1 OmpA family protein [Sulfitobacter sp. M72]